MGLLLRKFGDILESSKMSCSSYKLTPKRKQELDDLIHHWFMQTKFLCHKMSQNSTVCSVSISSDCISEGQKLPF